LKPKAKQRRTVPDPEQRGLYVRVMPSGAKSFVAVARDPHTHKQIWATLGTPDVMKIAEARERARSAIARIRDGLEPFEAPKPTALSFEAVAQTWMRRHVHAKVLRTAPAIERMLRLFLAARLGPPADHRNPTRRRRRAARPH
jgi:hypothetical protein